ncbi:MAG: aminotransferase class V-fold PLP-dependent enzyme [Euryarchaeota archaeon]|nr:aminotransferase class V-fold PLP-dependent enzyme [Euryarchaeota archaeon]
MALPEPFDRVRRTIPAAHRHTYLNTAATSPLPDAVREAVAASMQRRAWDGDLVFDDACADVDATRALVGQHLGVEADGIAFMKNTGEGINHVARSLDYLEGANVVTTSLEFPSNLLPWTALRKQGVEVRVVEPDDDGLGVTPERMAEHVDRDTTLVAVSWVTFQTGYRHDVDAFGRIAHDHGALMLVDGIQGLGALCPPRMDHIDFFANGGHKWLMAPFGVGFLYVRPELARTLVPDHVGWWSLADTDTYDPDNVTLAGSARRFEIGNLNFPVIAGLDAAFRIMPDIEDVERRILYLTTRLMRGLVRHGRLASPVALEKRSGIVNLATPDAKALHARLAKDGIIASLRGGGVRFSPHYWNTEEELEKVLALFEGTLQAS